MQIDLERHEAGAGVFRSQVCIVGAGIAGLTLAHRLGEHGIDVVLLEAGGPRMDANAQAEVANVQLEGQPHYGTVEGRCRALGGSSLRWGGQLLPLGDDLAWPIDRGELTPFVAEAERLLGVNALPYEAPAYFASIGSETPALLCELPELTASVSKWTPFARRNLALTLGEELLARDNVRLYLGAQVVELLPAASRSRITTAVVRTVRGETLRFEADHFIVAAGTVETVRLLLASRSVISNGVGNDCDQVGRNFHDHLTLPAATITGTARARLLRELRPWVRGSTVHSIKLEPSVALRKRLGIHPVVAHLTLEELTGSGLAVVRELLTALQRGDVRTALADHLAQLPAAALEGIRLVWSATVLRRRFVAPSTSVKLYLNTAQDAPSFSRVMLSPQLDAAGMPQAVVDWRVTPQELESLSLFAKHLSQHLPMPGVQWLVGVLSPDVPIGGMMLSRIQDARHAMGGACMGHDRLSSVVDPNLTVHCIANLSIASAATFPTGSPPLPVLPLMALSLRLAEYVAARLGQVSHGEA